MAKRGRTTQQQAMHECWVSRNHWWKWTTVDVEKGSYVQHMECMRCGGHRRWRVNRVTGHPEGNNYNMPEGYYHKRDEIAEDTTPQEFRNQLRISEVESHVSRAKLKRVQ